MKSSVPLVQLAEYVPLALPEAVSVIVTAFPDVDPLTT